MCMDNDFELIKIFGHCNINRIDFGLICFEDQYDYYRIYIVRYNASFIIEFTASFLQEKDKNSLKERLIRI